MQGVKKKKKKKKKEINGDYFAFCLRVLRRVSSSSSYRAGSTDIPDPLSPLLPIVHRPR